jgi:KAP family P-loop domain
MGVIWLPSNVDDTMMSWPPEARSLPSFKLTKEDGDSREIEELATFFRSLPGGLREPPPEVNDNTGNQFGEEFLKSASNANADGESPAQASAERAPGGPSRVPVSPSLSFERMTPGARRSLTRAERFARLGPDGQVHMEHLIAGLYQWAEGRTRSALTEAGVSSTRLAEILGLPESDLAPVSNDVVEPIDHMPELSTHVAQAFTNATRAPTLLGTRDLIRARHLFYGVLQVSDCTPVGQLLATPGLRIEDVLLDTSTATPRDVPSGGDNATITPAPAIPGRPVAGFQSDDATGDDLFQLDDEIDALATVIAAESVEPPLALGLFGDWGTGKTFFMNMLDQRIRQIAEEERNANRDDPFYCRHIVQLRFNAWHYIEQDLWASLASAIFDGLDQWITTTNSSDAAESDESKRARLLTRHARTLDGLESAERQGYEARKTIETIDASLDKLDDQYDELVRKVPKTEIVKAVVRIAADQPEIKQEAEAAQKAIREELKDVAGKTDTDSRELSNAISKGTLEGIRAAATGWWDFRRGWRLWLPLTIAIVIAVGIFVAVFSRVDLDPAIRAVSSALSAVLGLVIVYAGYLAYPALRVVGLARKAQVESDRLVENARMTQRTNLQDARKQAEELSVKADLNAAAKRKELDEVRRELQDTEPSREMATFIKRRQASEDYRSRLGVVAKARDDFEELTKLLAKQSTASSKVAETASQDGTPAELFTPIDRIVLYIDDLDRCKEEDVVAVLQAVHLLLAFRLFVVVVAVDPRWLLHSLKVTSRVLASADDDKGEPEDEAGWEATPLNYLEKIFQIPYALRPMGKTGFQALVTNLVPSAAVPTNGSTASGSTPAVAVAPEVGLKATDSGNGHGPESASATVTQGAAGEGSIGPSPSQSADAQPGVPAPEPPASDGGVAPTHASLPAASAQAASLASRPVDMSPIALDITDDERACMFELHELIATPRSAKRFVNVYRLFKASCLPSERVELSDPSRYRPILLMLAVLTGYPAEATVILRALLERAPAGAWLEFVVGLKEPRELTNHVQAGQSPSGDAEYVPKNDLQFDKINSAERWAALQNKLTRIDASIGPIDASLFRPWARRVARYGFESSRVLVTDETRQEPAPVG